MKRVWMLLMVMLMATALPLCALTEGLEVEYEEAVAVMVPEETPDGESEVFSESLEPAVEESGELTLGEDGIAAEAEGPAYADFV